MDRNTDRSEILAGKSMLFDHEGCDNAVAGQSLARSDVFISLLLFSVGCLFAAWFVSAGIVKRNYFYQERFAPAVMHACGHGFYQPRPEPQELTEFLALKRDKFYCDAIPARVEVVPPDIFQTSHRYLMLSASWAWRHFGFTWSGLTPLYAVLFGTTTMMAYLLSRLVMVRPLALLCAGLMLISPVQLFNLPHLRDYAKAPFMLALITLLAFGLCTRNYGLRGWLGLSGIAGCLLGIGIGFRIDVITFGPIFIIILMFLSPGRFKEYWAKKLLCGVAFLLGFLLFGWPILEHYRGGNNMPHVIVLGLMGEFDAKLGLQPAFYEVGYHYLDMYVNTLISAYATFQGYYGGAIGYPSKLYDTYTTQYFQDFVHHFPADIAARFIGAGWQVLHLPFRAFVTFEDVYFFYDDLITPGAKDFARSAVWDYLLIMAMLVSLVVLSLKGFKTTMAVVLVVVYLIGYPFLQFGVRHYFYLQIVGLWFCGLACHALFKSVRRLRKRGLASLTMRSELVGIKSHLITLFSILLVCVVIPWAVFVGLRAYQSAKLKPKFEYYYNMPSTLLETDDKVTPSGILVVPKSLFGDSEFRENGIENFNIIFVVASFDRRRCGRSEISVKYDYAFDSEPFNFNLRTMVGIDNSTRVIFPVFLRHGHLRFNGLEMRETERACLQTLAKLVDNDGGFFPLTIRFSEQWQDEPRYRQFVPPS